MGDTPDIVERLRHPQLLTTDMSYHREVVGKAADEIEKLRADIKAINPAIKCRSGCHVVKERFGDDA